MNRILVIAAFFTVMTLAACATPHGHGRGHSQAAARLLYSPNGEPLNGGPLGRPSCQDAMTRWFDRVDVRHDNAVTRDEFLADARTQFQKMDIDANGYLVPEELSRFRQPYRQFSSTAMDAAPPDDDEETPPPSMPHRHGRHSGMGRNGGGQSNVTQDNGAAVDPVMSADTNLDNKVTPAEFMAHAQIVFTALDADHNNVLSHAEALGSCGQKP